MKREYIILKEEHDLGFGLESVGGPRAPESMRGSKGSERGGVASLRIEVGELTEREHELINRDPGTSTAPPMETQLVTPLEVADNGPAAAGTDAWGLEAVGAQAAWDAGYTGAGVTVAVLDTGIDKTHPAFAGVNIVEKDFSGDGNGDYNGHGTHAAATVFGRKVDGVSVGVAPGIEKAYIGKVLRDNGRGSTKMIVRGLNWAATDLGVDVITLSLGIDFTRQVKRAIEDWNYEKDQAASQTLLDFAQNIRMFDRIMQRVKSTRPFEDAGSLVLAATGNDSKETYRIATSLPAFSSGVMSVGATELSGEIRPDGSPLHRVARFSNSPPTVVAPGVNILSARTGGGLTQKSGTSMACPHVAGVAALWWDYVRRRPIPSTAVQVEARLLNSCRYDVFLPGTTEDDRGTGLVNSPL